MLAILCALGSALMYATASVLQQRAAAAQDAEHSLRIGLMTRLVQSRAWLAGIVADVFGYVLQFVALSRGAIVVVQPLLVSGLLFALPLGAWFAGVRLRRADWTAALAVCGGLAVFLLAAQPANGHHDVRVVVWVELLVPSAIACGVLLAMALNPWRPSHHKAVLLSAVAGIAYGVSAALTKAVAHQLSRSLPTVVTHWQVYVLVAVGSGGMLVAQSAFQAGSLDASLPTMTVVDPVVSGVRGAFAFGESLDLGVGPVTLQVLALAAMVGGVFALARTGGLRQLHPEAHAPAT